MDVGCCCVGWCLGEAGMTMVMVVGVVGMGVREVALVVLRIAHTDDGDSDAGVLATCCCCCCCCWEVGGVGVGTACVAVGVA